jgi:putative ABC transport system substrate-binding protein
MIGARFPWLRRLTALIAAASLAANVPAGPSLILLQSRDTPPYRQAAAAFLEAWKVYGPDGGVEHRTLPDAGNTNAAIIVAVGTEAAQWAIQHTTGTVVFCMAANARQNLLAPLSESDRPRVTGVTMLVPVRTQFQRIQTMLPEVKRIGVLYDPRHSSLAVEDARAAAAELGLTLIAVEVRDETDLPAAIRSVAGRMDLLWATVDGTVYNSRSAQFVLAEMLKRKIPVMGFSENMVQAGALLAPSVDYTDIGRQTARLVHTIVTSGQRPPPEPPQQFTMAVNAHVWKLLRGTLPAFPSEVKLVDEH